MKFTSKVAVTRTHITVTRVSNSSMIICTALVLALGCANATAEPRPDLELKYQSKHYRVATAFPDRLCKGTLEVLESHERTLERLLGTELEPVDIYLYGGALQCESKQVGGCYQPSRFIKTDWSAVKHEIVHALTAQWAVADRMYQEGMAEAFNGARSTFVDTLPSSNAGSAVDYPGARHFVRWLYEWRGAEALRALFRSSPSLGREGAFESAYGITLGEADARYFSDAMDLYPGLEECGATPLPWSGAAWEQSLTLDCDSDTTWGFGNMLRDVTVDVPTRGRYFVDLAPSNAEVLISSCETANLGIGQTPRQNPAALGYLTVATPTEVDLEPGRYQIEMRLPASTATVVRIRLAQDLAFVPDPPYEPPG